MLPFSTLGRLWQRFQTEIGIKNMPKPRDVVIQQEQRLGRFGASSDVRGCLVSAIFESIHLYIGIYIYTSLHILYGMHGTSISLTATIHSFNIPSCWYSVCVCIDIYIYTYIYMCTYTLSIHIIIYVTNNIYISIHTYIIYIYTYIQYTQYTYIIMIIITLMIYIYTHNLHISMWNIFIVRIRCTEAGTDGWARAAMGRTRSTGSPQFMGFSTAKLVGKGCWRLSPMVSCG